MHISLKSRSDNSALSEMSFDLGDLGLGLCQAWANLCQVMSKKGGGAFEFFRQQEFLPSPHS